MFSRINECTETKIVIDSRSLIDPSAKISEGVEIGPFSIIGPNVEIGAGTVIGSHVVIKENTKIGKNNRIHPFAALGDDPQHTGIQNAPTYLEIGDENVIREFSTIHRGSTQGRTMTVVGNRNYFMNYTHIAHDCIVGNEVILANNASLAGHVQVDDYVIFGAFCAAHQYVTIGAYSFLGRTTKVGQDIPPYVLVTGFPGAPHGLNAIGLKRRGFSDRTVRTLRKAYLLVYREDVPLNEAITTLDTMVAECPEMKIFIDAIKNTKRGLARKGLKASSEEVEY